MWGNTSAVYASAETDDLVTAPLTKPKQTSWQKTGRWIREHPWTTALLAVLAAGIIVAVVVGPVVGLQNKKSEKGEGSPAQSSDFKITFQAANASDICAELARSGSLSSYAANLQSSIAALLGIQAGQVAVRSIQCGSQTFDLAASGATRSRRMLRATVAGSDAPSEPLPLILVFSLLPPAPSQSAAPAPAAPAEVATRLQSEEARTTLEKVISQVLGLPPGSVVLVSVETAVPAPPTSATTAPPPAVQPVAAPSPELPLSPPPVYGPSGDGAAMPPTYPEVVSRPPPVWNFPQPPSYGGYGNQPPLPQPPSYGGYGQQPLPQPPMYVFAN